MDVLQILRQAARDQSGIRLLNIYKGLPISYDTSIASVGTAEIQVPSSKNHIACLYYQGETYLQGEALPAIIRSKVVRLNLASDFAIFGDFEAVKNDIGKRMQIRVQPDEPLIVSIQFKGSAYDFLVPLDDISANGASFFFENYMFPARLAQPGNELTMTITIPDFVARKMKKLSQRPGGEGRKVTAPLPLRPTPSGGLDGQIVITASGKVITIRSDVETQRYRVSSQLFFKDLSRMVILQYISHRQTEIINDLRLLSEDLYNGKKR